MTHIAVLCLFGILTAIRKPFYASTNQEEYEPINETAVGALSVRFLR